MIEAKDVSFLPSCFLSFLPSFLPIFLPSFLPFLFSFFLQKVGILERFWREYALWRQENHSMTRKNGNDHGPRVQDWQTLKLQVSMKSKVYSFGLPDFWNRQPFTVQFQKKEAYGKEPKRFYNNQSARTVTHLCLLRMETTTIAMATILCMCHTMYYLIFPNFLHSLTV